MISVKEAAINAYEYIKGIPGYEDKEELLVEEVELTEDEKYWLITLGYPVIVASGVLFQPATRKKEYKLFKVNAETGEVLSMKIREI